jgi:hypothetical protein
MASFRKKANYGLREKKKKWATVASFEKGKPTMGRERNGKPTLG